MEVRFIQDENKYILEGTDTSSLTEANKWLHYLAATGKSPNTVRSYAYHLCLWLRFCEVKDTDCLKVFANTECRPVDFFTDFLCWLQYPDLHEGILHLSKEAPQRSNRTLNLIMSAVLSFYEYLSSNNALSELPVYRTQRINSAYKSFLSELYHHSLTTQSSLLKKPVVTNPVEYITREQYHEMIQHCYLLRDKLILSLLFEGGLRLGEALGIHLCDLDQLEEGVIRITPRENNENGARVKRLAEGIIKIPDYVVTWILRYLSTDLADFDTDYLFVSFSGPRKGLALKPDSVEKLFQRISDEMHTDIHPHMLRHGFATEKLASGWELIDIQAYLRHKSIHTTEIYAFYSNDLKIRNMQKFFTDNYEKMKETANAIGKLS